MSEVIKIENTTDLSVTLTTTLSDDSTSTGEFKVGEGVQKLVYLDRGKDGVISGTVKGIKYSLDSNCKDITILAFVISNNDNGEEVEIPVKLIKLCGTPEVKVEEGQDLSSVLSSIEDGQVISVPATTEGTEATPIEFSKSVTIKGAKTEVSALDESRANDSIEEETVLGAVTTKEDVNISLIGVAVTGNIDISTGSKEIGMRNCKMVNIVPTAAKTYPVLISSKTNPDSIKLEVRDCYFGNVKKDPEKDNYNIYNYFEISKPLIDGSIIENCYFAKEACTHNLINIYDVEDGATITIRNCVFEYSANAIRIGIKGDKHCTINIENCTYLDTCNDDYAGLFFIQPYASKTTDMSHITINVKGTVNKSNNKQLWYKYAGKSDMQFDEFNVPTVIVDGKIEMAPKKKQ